MQVTAGNIYSGPVDKIESSSDGGTTWSDWGAIADGANVEINFDPNVTQMGDGQNLKKFGLFTWKADILETHTSNLSLLQAAESTPVQLRITGLDGKTYTTVALLVTHKTKRGFGKDPHMITAQAQKYAINEDDVLTIV
ncbi:MAG TPA: hypothetical protein ENJ15_04390 [Caldithrix abyssi]|uniref:Uncharacterized protein n=1 Tax=Caldithrix abyssi TaxID=187145 RepID=A0A7V5VF07_CALAY|nr:hypothetical protein [Caldithrix abyssi]